MNLFKTLAGSLPILLILFWSCQPQEEEEILQKDTREQEVENYLADAEERYIDPASRKGADVDPATLSPCNDPSENQYPLVAWYNKEVGHIQVSNDEEYLIAAFTLDRENLYLRHTKFVAVIKEQKIYKKWGKKYKYTRYKKYVYPMRHEPGTMKYTYVIPLEDLNLDIEKPDQELSFMGIAHLAVDGPRYKHYRFALAENPESDRFFGKWLIDYTLAECLGPPPINGCSLSWAEGEPYTYDSQTGFTDLYTTKRDGAVTKTVYANIEGDDIGTGIPVGTAEIDYFYFSDRYSVSVNVNAFDGYILEELKIEVGLGVPDSEPNQYIVKADDDKTRIGFSKTIQDPREVDRYITVAVVVCDE